MDEFNEDDFNERKKRIQELIKNLAESKSRITEFDDIDELEAKLGSPHRVESFIKDGFNYLRKIWDTETGEITLLYIYSPEDITDMDKKLNAFSHIIKDIDMNGLEQLLDDAIADEEYEAASIIRDEINTRKIF